MASASSSNVSMNNVPVAAHNMSYINELIAKVMNPLIEDYNIDTHQNWENWERLDNARRLSIIDKEITEARKLLTAKLPFLRFVKSLETKNADSRRYIADFKDTEYKLDRFAVCFIFPYEPYINDTWTATFRENGEHDITELLAERMAILIELRERHLTHRHNDTAYAFDHAYKFKDAIEDIYQHMWKELCIQIRDTGISQESAYLEIHGRAKSKELQEEVRQRHRRYAESHRRGGRRRTHRKRTHRKRAHKRTHRKRKH